MATTFLSDDQTVVAKLDPVSQAAGTVATGWIDMSKFSRVQFLLAVGAISAGGTVDAAVRQATSSAGANAKALSPARAVTQLTQAGTNSNSVCAMNVRGSDLDTNAGFQFVQLQVTVATAAALLAVLALGDPEATPPTTSTGSLSVQILG